MIEIQKPRRPQASNVTEPVVTTAATTLEPAFAPATELLAAIRRREIGCRELLACYRERIERLDGRVNAVVTLDERALDRAAAADAALARGETWGPLHGLPVTVKDSLCTAGLRTSAGAVELADHVPDADAEAVARLRAAGAVVFGKTNLPRFALDVQTYNELFGTTCNPWAPDRTPGGSSGGSAAALAAGLTALELGSDIGGSIRAPAHCCGVFGHKPSHGLVPLRGHIPPGPPDNLREYDMAVLGPLARSARDLDLALSVLAGPGRADAVAWRLRLPPPRRSALREYRVAVWFDDPGAPIDDAVRAPMEHAVRLLGAAGATVATLAEPPVGLAEHERLAQQLMQGEICEDLPARLYAELLELASAPDPSDGSEHLRWARDVTARKRDWNAADAQRQRLRVRWAELFDRFDAVLTPALAVPAFPHDHRPDGERVVLINGEPRRYWELGRWPTLANVSRLPAAVAPIGMTADGLPVGIQVLGPYLEDRTAIDLAGRIAELTGGTAQPPGYR